MTIEGLRFLRRQLTGLLLWLGLIEYRSVPPEEYPPLRVVQRGDERC